jgi:hypothetical protein
VNVAAGTGAYFKGNDPSATTSPAKSCASTPSRRTLSPSSAASVTGGTGIARVGSADTIVRSTNASISGGTLPAIRMAKVVFNFNYCQITARPDQRHE